jgi:predicted protein tyrosine phosphatase
MFRIKYTTHISMRNAEKIARKNDVKRALISITTPGFPDAKIDLSAWDDVLRLKFHDFHWEDGVHKVLTEAQATEVLRFLSKNQHETDELIVHCEMGVSRSAAMAKFIAEIYNLDFDMTYNRHNRFVYTLLKRVYGQYAHCAASLTRAFEPPGYYKSMTTNASVDQKAAKISSM